MNKSYTSRLYFGKYPYKIDFYRVGQTDSKSWPTGWNPHKFTTWLNKKNIDHRVYTKIRFAKRLKQVKVKMSVFFANKDIYDLCLKRYSKYINSVTEPYAPTHVDLLKDNTSIIVRKTLIYKKFKYVINFRRSWHHSIDDISEWMFDTYNNQLFKTNTMKWVGTGWNPRIYLSDESDLVFIKLTWGERIRSITVVCTLDELDSKTSIR